jgi:two-component system, chemotaxis family, chemotaxis protein CheY
MDSAPGGGRRILVVDSDQRIRAVIRDRLSAWGFEVVEAENGQDGPMPAVDNRVPQIHGILLDVHKPVPDGLAPLHLLRRLHPGIPVIVMSDASNIQTAREAINQGAQEYVLKPFDHELLKMKCLRIF